MNRTNEKKNFVTNLVLLYYMQKWRKTATKMRTAFKTKNFNFILIKIFLFNLHILSNFEIKYLEFFLSRLGIFIFHI